MKRKIILDCDTGTDDAIAILLAACSEKLDLLAITTVNGNRGVEFTTENTLRVVDLLNKDIPVYKGCALPIAATLIKGRKDNVPYRGQEDSSQNVHQDYLDLPESARKPEALNAVSYIVETLMQSDEKITLVPVGPLTNIATALRIEPRIKKKIEEIVIMGGGWHENNITPAAEFNFWIDPEAAKIVLHSGCRTTLIPLDATHSAAVSIKITEKLRALNNPIGNFSSRTIESRLAGYNKWQPMEDQSTVPVHDALAIAALIDRSVLKKTVRCFVDVDVSGGICDGQSVCDVQHKISDANPNVDLAIEGDADKFMSILVNTFSRSEEI